MRVGVCTGVDSSSFVDLSPLLGKEFSLFDPLDRQSVQFQWCYMASLVSNTSQEYKRNDPFPQTPEAGPDAVCAQGRAAC